MNNVRWDLIESGPAGADRSVLCLAGALCTGEFFAELMAEPALAVYGSSRRHYPARAAPRRSAT